MLLWNQIEDFLNCDWYACLTELMNNQDLLNDTQPYL